MEIADWATYANPDDEFSDNMPFIMFNQEVIPDQVKTLLQSYEQLWTTAKLLADDEHNIVAVVPK